MWATIPQREGIANKYVGIASDWHQGARRAGAQSLSHRGGRGRGKGQAYRAHALNAGVQGPTSSYPNWATRSKY